MLVNCHIASTRKEDLLVKKDKINQLLERLGLAISSNDLAGISACWTFPALFLSDQTATVISDARQLEQMMAQAVEAYRKQGLASTRHELEQVDELSETLTSMDVRWPAYDASGKEKASERSHYILHLAEDGQVRIRVALTRTKPLAE
jgi:NTF2-like protein (DUF6841)